MRRRDFIVGLGGVAVWPIVARAQARRPVVGVLSGARADQTTRVVVAFRQGLRDQGFVEGQNVEFLYRWADTRLDRLPQLAAELVDHPVDVIAIVGGTAAALAAKSATDRVPIVFEAGSDPIALGLVPSLSRPGGNVTGATFLGQVVIAKRLELLRQLLPSARSFGYLANPTSQQTAAQVGEAERAAGMLGLHLIVQMASRAEEIERAFESFREQRVGGIAVDSDILFLDQRDHLVMLSRRNAMPAIYHAPEIVEAGGLLSYGGALTDAYRFVGEYVGRILKGEKPATLPVQQSTRLEMFINLKTAKELGLEIPQSILLRADEVIE